MAKRNFQLDDETGEFVEVFGTFISDKQREAIQSKKIKKINETNQDEFIWSLFNYCSEIFPNLSKPSITRLFYIATFVEYNGDRLTFDGGYTFIGKRQLKGKLNLTDNVFTDFWNEMISNNILKENEEKLVTINTKLFRRGSIDRRCNKDFTRIYCECVRCIYENTKDIRDHTKLSYIFKIIPFVNRKTNIVSYNPEEMDDKKIKPMTIGDFCDVINYNKKNAYRLFKDLAKFTIKGKHLMCYVAIDKFNINGMFIIVNPEIYYGGAVHHEAQFIFNACDMKTN